MKLKNLLWVCALLLCSACVVDSLNVKNQVDKLSVALDHYGADLRWGRYNYAYALHVKRDGTKPKVDMDRLEGYSITSFTPNDSILSTDATEALIPVEIKYYDEQHGMLRTHKETQKWWFDANSKMWFIETDFPELK